MTRGQFSANATNESLGRTISLDAEVIDASGIDWADSIVTLKGDQGFLYLAFDSFTGEGRPQFTFPEETPLGSYEFWWMDLRDSVSNVTRINNAAKYGSGLDFAGGTNFYFDPDQALIEDISVHTVSDVSPVLAGTPVSLSYEVQFEPSGISSL